jgi:adenylate cyclase
MSLIAELKHGSLRKLLFTMIGVLFVALVYLAVDKFEREDEPERASVAREKSIAVLPFANMSGDPEDDYFAYDLRGELINRVAQVPELLVLGRTSDCPTCDQREIAEKLGVSYALDGSVRRQGNQARITAQLVSLWDGSQLWSQTYDRTGNPFAIQEDIAEEIVGALVIVLDEEARRHMQQAGVHNGKLEPIPEVSAAIH